MLAMIAGQGALPGIIANAAPDLALVASLDGFDPDTVSTAHRFRIEHLGSFLNDLTDKGITDVVFAGSLRRPPLDPAKVDASTMPLVPRMMTALQQGDDAALCLVLTFFEEAGFKVKAAHEIEPRLLPKSGILTTAKPTDQHKHDAARAAKSLTAIGASDIGQACVVKNGQVLCVEGSFGTDWMLDSLRNRPDEQGGVFYKAPKPEQDRRIDLPAIGPETLENVAKAGLDGVVIEAGGVMVLDLDAALAKAEARGLFLWVRAR